MCSIMLYESTLYLGLDIAVTDLVEIDLRVVASNDMSFGNFVFLNPWLYAKEM